MNTSKQHYEGKLQVTGDLGDIFDKQLEQAERSTAVAEGGKKALREAAKRTVTSIHQRVDQDLEAGKLDLSKFQSEIQLASALKAYITLVGEGLTNLAAKYESEQMVASGKVIALRGVLQTTQRHHSSAASRVQQLGFAELEQEAVESENQARARRAARSPGEHPGPSPLDERRAAARAQKAEAAKEEKKPPAKKETKKPASKKTTKKTSAKTATAKKTKKTGKK